jgi:hypothetical protein
MSEGQGVPPADVRSFLPRPGESVEDYAARLRKLHRDLTLVLEAVERGLAAAAGEEAPRVETVADEPRFTVPEPRAHEPIEVVPEPPEPAPAAPRPGGAAVRSAVPRVEVMPPPTGEDRRADAVDARRAEPEPPRPAAPFPARPSAAADGARREPEWVEREPPREAFTPPTFPSPAAGAPQGIVMTRALLAAFAVAWLVVVALLVAVLAG